MLKLIYYIYYEYNYFNICKYYEFDGYFDILFMLFKHVNYILKNNNDYLITTKNCIYILLICLTY